MSATVGDGEGQPSVDGTLHIRDYHVKDAPLIARLLGMMAISGIDDALRGDGVRFSVLEVPFRLDTGILRIDDARASGTAIGVTASGEVDLPDDRMNLYGTVVPFYLINGALGRIPVLGSVLSGGEKGGGLFAATYKVTGPVEDPDVSVNALATLAPGFLRRLFSGSDPGTAGSGNGSGAGASSP